MLLYNGTSSDAFYHKGFALYHKGKHCEAAHAFLQGLKLNPSDRVLKQVRKKPLS